MASWLVPPEVLAQSPSRSDGMSEEEERTYRRRTAIFIEEAGVALKIPRLIIATAQVFFHRFFALQSFRQHKRFVVAVTCLFLAGKVEEAPKKLQPVVIRCHELWHRKSVPPVQRMVDTSPEYEQLRQDILKCERILLHTIAFDFCVEHPYKYVIEAIKTVHNAGMMKNHEECKKIAKNAAELLNGSMRTNLCLQYKPQKVASAAIFLASMFLRFDIPEENMPQWMGLLKLTKEELSDLCEQIMQVYAQYITEDQTHPMRTLADKLKEKQLISGVSVAAAKPASSTPKRSGAEVAAEDRRADAASSRGHERAPAMKRHRDDPGDS